MVYSQMKEKLTGLFDYNKLQASPQEWGFYNETEKEIQKIGYATNLTEDIIRKAETEDVDFLLTHHDTWEFIFGMKESCNKLLRESGIAHAFFHAPLDGADFGTSASLARALNMRDCWTGMPYAQLYECGVMGTVESIEFDEFKGILTGILQEEVRCYRNNNKKVQRIAIVAGGGNMTNEMKIAAENGCDTYITGEYALYSQLYADYTGMNLFVGSHTNTEILGVEAMAVLLSKDTDIQIVRLKEPNY